MQQFLSRQNLPRPRDLFRFRFADALSSANYKSSRMFENNRKKVLLVFTLCAIYIGDVHCKELKDVKIERLDGGECKNGAKKGDTVSIQYTGSLTTGKVFDSSKDRSPLEFKLGSGKVVPGMERGVLGMCIGEKRKLTIPHHLAYGDKGIPEVIPPKSTLIFEVELVSVEGKGILTAVISFFVFLSAPFVIGGIIYYYFVQYKSKGKVSKKKAREESKQNKKKK